MLIRLAALVALLASLIACTPDSDVAPPSGRSVAMVGATPLSA